MSTETDAAEQVGVGDLIPLQLGAPPLLSPHKLAGTQLRLFPPRKPAKHVYTRVPAVSPGLAVIVQLPPGTVPFLVVPLAGHTDGSSHRHGLPRYPAPSYPAQKARARATKPRFSLRWCKSSGATETSCGGLRDEFTNGPDATIKGET